MIRSILYVLILFFLFSYTLPAPVVSESRPLRKDEWMTDMSLFAEHQVRADLARLLLAAVETSGQPRCAIARKAQIHKDALRRVLAGERSASIAETLRILGKQPGILGDIYAGAQSRFNNPVNLKKLINLIDETEWTSLGVDVKAAAYEGLLEKNAQDTKSGAGQAKQDDVDVTKFHDYAPTYR